MTKRYANGKDVFPLRLLRELQRPWQGRVWIPVSSARKWKTRSDGERNRKIVAARRRGVPTAVLAVRFALSQERIWKIVSFGQRCVAPDFGGVASN